MSDLMDLYQEMILDHSKTPRNAGALEHPTHRAVGHNPLCGDRLDVTLLLDDGRVADVRFAGQGCAISTASASLMTEAVRGKTLPEVKALFETFHAMVTGKAKADPDTLGKLAVFSGVSEFPIRVKCATLSWHTLNAALEQKSEPVSTE
jgi:nitrogen fixation NifU-like protein